MKVSSYSPSVALLCCCVTSVLDAAEITSNRSSRILEEVVVTAQKRKENLADVPISIQAFSSDSLEARGVNSTADLPRITPGLTVTTQINFTATFLRGIGSDAWLLGDPSVVTYTDGVYNPFAIGQTSDFGDIERVEILKGPQGTLFGRNAIGGALNIITAEPSFEEVYLSAQGEYASFNKQKFSLSINAPVGSRFAINLAGFYSEADDHRDGRINGSPLPREELKSGRIKALWQVADNFELGLNVTRLDQNALGSLYAVNTEPSPLGSSLGVTAGDPYAGENNEMPIGTLDNESFSAQAVFTGQSFDAKLLYSDQEVVARQSFDFDSSSAPVAFFFGNPIFSNVQTAELQILSNDESIWSSWLEWVGGVYYFKSSNGFDPGLLNGAHTNLARGQLFGIAMPQSVLDLVNQQTLGGTTPSGQIYVRGRLGTESIAYFVQGTASFSDDFSITIGGRYQDETRTILQSESGFMSTDGAGIPYQNLPKDSVTTRSFNPKISLNFRPSLRWLGEDPLLYLSAQTSTKSATLNVANILPADPAELVRPEEITAFEAGIKTSYRNGEMLVNAAAFYYQIDDLQVQVLSLATGGAITFENADKTSVNGVEFDSLFVLFPSSGIDLVLTASAAYIDAIYDSYPNGAGFDENSGIFGRQDYSGNEVVRSPKFSGNLGILNTLQTEHGPLELGNLCTTTLTHRMSLNHHVSCIKHGDLQLFSACNQPFG